MGWGSLGVVGGAALLTVVAGEIVLRQAVPPIPEGAHVYDGVAAYEAGDPEVLIIGSTHVRCTDAIRERVNAKKGAGTLIQVPIRGGKSELYQWVLHEQLRPLMAQRKRLKHLIWLSEWWDDCSATWRVSELPKLTWNWRHFWADLKRDGLNPYNRHYLRRYLRNWGAPSTLIGDLGSERIVETLKRRFRPLSPEREAHLRQTKLKAWRGMVEAGARNPACYDGRQSQILLDELKWFQARGVEVTVVLWARMPTTLTDKAKATTLARHAKRMHALGAEHGFRVLEWTWQNPLLEEDFLPDWDHLRRSGKEKMADHALNGGLRFLLD